MLPGRFPNLLVNGASGIAVGLATNIPTHNLGEAIDAVIAVMDNPKITLDEVMRVLPSAGFPHRRLCCSTPRKSVRLTKPAAAGCCCAPRSKSRRPMRARRYLVITELPYQVNKAARCWRRF